MKFFYYLMGVFSLPSLGCKLTIDNSIAIYSSQCAVTVSHQKTPQEPILLQFKFSKKMRSDVLQEVRHVQSLLDYPVSLQEIKSGYRLFLGPMKSTKIPLAKIRLAKLGYTASLLKRPPQTSKKHNANVENNTILSQNKPKKAVSSSEADTIFSYMSIAQIDQSMLYTPMSNPSHLQRFSYNQAKRACAVLGANSRMANQYEYVNLMASKAFISEISTSLAVPFWLTENTVITRVEQQIEQRRASVNTKYSVICTSSAKF
ncbi:hypothetical protein ACPV3S_20760 [Photobacterium damselae]|uniref:hypothetical protein n=1 Tax=Photobacterium damselae TaxID=38293 RepID=UPI00406983C1